MNTIPKEAIAVYLKALVNKVYKILPMKEENNNTLRYYLSGLSCELAGFYQLHLELVDEPRFLSVISIVKHLETGDYDAALCKREVFKAIRLVQDIAEEVGKHGDF